MSEEVKMMSGMTCKCGNTIEITVPMYVTVDDHEIYICKECFDKAKEENTIEKHLELFEKYYLLFSKEELGIIYGILSTSSIWIEKHTRDHKKVMDIVTRIHEFKKGENRETPVSRTEVK